MTSQDKVRAKRLEIHALVHGFSTLSEEEAAVVRQLRDDRARMDLARMSATETFIDLVGAVGPAGIAQLLADALDVEADTDDETVDSGAYVNLARQVRIIAEEIEGLE